MVICFSIIFLYLCQIHTFKNNLHDEEMLVSHLVWCTNYIIKGNLFHDKNNIKLFERRKQWQKNFHKKPPEVFQEKTCLEVSFLQLYQKETPTQVFSCEYWEIFKNTVFEEHLPDLATVASEFW